jgi:hypothetical protein
VDIIAYDLYRNELSAGAWVQVRVIGGASGGPADGWTDWSGMSNVSGIGAVVTLVTNQGIQLRQISGGSGTGVQDSFVQHFGLKEGDEIEEIQILFPGGNEVIVNDVQSNQRIWIHEDGSQRVGFGFPIDLLPIVTQ